LTPQKKNSRSKKRDQLKDKFVDKDKGGRISQQAEDKARQEAEKKAQLIIQQAEDKARQEAEKKAKEITNQEITKMIDYYPHKESRKLTNNSYNENNESYNPFMTGINLWQNYSKMWIDLTKEILNNTLNMAEDLENTYKKNRIFFL